MRIVSPYTWWKDQFNNTSLQTEKRIQAANALVLLENPGATAFLVQYGLFDKDIIIADGVLDILIRYSEYKRRVIITCMSHLRQNLKEIKNKDTLFRAIEILVNLKYLGAVEILNEYAIHSDHLISNRAHQALKDIGFSTDHNKVDVPEGATNLNPTFIPDTHTPSLEISPFDTESYAVFILHAV